MQTLKDYLSTLQNKRVAVVGIGISNTPLIQLLVHAGVQVTACDKKEKEELGDLARSLEESGVKLSLGSQYLDALDHDVIFRSPGIRPDIPAFVSAREKGSRITRKWRCSLRFAPVPSSQ